MLLTATANLKRTMESEEMEFKDLQRKLQDTLNSLGNEKEEEYGMSLAYNGRGDEVIEKHIAELRKHIDQKHEVGLQVDELTKSAEEVELMGMDTKTRITMDAIKQKLIDTEEKLEQNAALTGPLIAKERECNDELQEAPQELISGLVNNTKDPDASIAVRSMGVFHESVFLAAARELYPRKDATAKARELISVEHLH